jgi:hypothetical protein
MLNFHSEAKSQNFAAAVTEIDPRAISDHCLSGLQKSDWVSIFEAQSLVLFYIQLSSLFKLFDLEKFQVKGSLDSWINYYFKFKNRSTLFLMDRLKWFINWLFLKY